MYHGTEKKRGIGMVANQKMIASVSDDKKQHWLGDGIYLYKELFYAFRWIVLMYQNYYSVEPKEDLLEKYSIIRVDMDYNPERIFNLDNPEHYIVFKYVEEKYKKTRAFSDKLAQVEYTDGVVLNILFKNLKYIENYDAVEAIFRTYELDSKFTSKSRFKTINEYQICVKNDKIIHNIKDITNMIEFEELHKRLQRFDAFKRSKGAISVSYGKYSNNRRGDKNGKW